MDARSGVPQGSRSEGCTGGSCMPQIPGRRPPDGSLCGPTESAPTRTRLEVPSGGSSSLPNTNTSRTNSQTSSSSSSNPYIVFILPHNNMASGGPNCHNCKERGFLNSLSQVAYAFFLQFCPWVGAIIFIYYVFVLLGIGPGFMAIVFVVGVYSMFTWLFSSKKSENMPPQNDVEGEIPQQEPMELPTPTVIVENFDDEVRNDSEAKPPPIVLEPPPSYEDATSWKGSPLDISRHFSLALSRAQSTTSLGVESFEDGSSNVHDRRRSSFLSIPSVDGEAFTTEDSGNPLFEPPSRERFPSVCYTTDDEEEDCLPTYQDAILNSQRKGGSINSSEAPPDYPVVPPTEAAPELPKEAAASPSPTESN